jgi:hypothetical protein
MSRLVRDLKSAELIFALYAPEAVIGVAPRTRHLLSR